MYHIHSFIHLLFVSITQAPWIYVNNLSVDDFPNELPLVRSIKHHIDLTPQASLPNKAAYKMTPAENVEISRQMQ